MVAKYSHFVIRLLGRCDPTERPILPFTKPQVDLTTAAVGVRDESGCLVLGSLAGHVRRQSVVGLTPSLNYCPKAAQAVSEKSAAG